MVVNGDMVDRQHLLVLGTGSRQREEVYEILLSQSCGRTSCHRRYALVEYIDWAIIWARFVAWSLGFSGSVERSRSGWLVVSPHVSEAVMLKMIRHVAQGLQDVSLASCLVGS